MGRTSSHGWAHFPCGSAAHAGRPCRRRRKCPRSPAERRAQQPARAATVFPRFNIAGFSPKPFRNSRPPPREGGPGVGNQCPRAAEKGRVRGFLRLAGRARAWPGTRGPPPVSNCEMHSSIDDTLQDLRYAFRGLRRNPGSTLTAVLAAAIAIGATTAVFSAVDRILFRPLPYRDDARLVSAGIMTPLDTNEFMFADAYFDLRRNPGPFAAVTSFQAGAIACDLTEQSPLRMRCLRLEANFLDTLGVRLAAGRNFSAEEDRPNGPRVAIISHALWRSRFAADPAAIGKTLNIDGTPALVVGVLPADFIMPTLTHADILLPEALDEARERQGRALRVFARLKPGVTLPQ